MDDLDIYSKAYETVRKRIRQSSGIEVLDFRITGKSKYLYAVGVNGYFPLYKNHWFKVKNESKRHFKEGEHPSKKDCIEILFSNLAENRKIFINIALKDYIVLSAEDTVESLAIEYDLLA